MRCRSWQRSDALANDGAMEHIVARSFLLSVILMNIQKQCNNFSGHVQGLSEWTHARKVPMTSGKRTTMPEAL